MLLYKKNDYRQKWTLSIPFENFPQQSKSLNKFGPINLYFLGCLVFLLPRQIGGKKPYIFF